MVAAAAAIPGKPNTATSTATSHNLLPVPRMLISLVIATSCRAPRLALRSDYPGKWADFITGFAIGATLSYRLGAALPTAQSLPRLSAAVHRREGGPQVFSKASDSANLGSRSGTSACRRISQLAVATNDPPTVMSAATSSSDGLSPSGWSVGITCQ